MHKRTIRNGQLRMALGLLMVISLGLLLSVQQVSAAEKTAATKMKNTPMSATEYKAYVAAKKASATTKTAPVTAKTAPVMAKATSAAGKAAPAAVKAAPAEEKKAPARDKNAPPDYTKGEAGNTPSWALGSTGMSGSFWWHTPRMIKISYVRPGTPADGKLNTTDVILGVGASTNFTSDAHRALSSAITAAEASTGKLVLTIWRPVTNSVIKDSGISGKVLKVTLNLPVKGAYSATSPWNCAKTKVLVNDAAEAVVRAGLRGGKCDNLNALGLLATGEKKYLPQVADYARNQAKACEAFDIMGGPGTGSWEGGYLNIFLTEYYLLTKDETVLPGIKALSEYMSYGQSGVGTWSHCMANVGGNGLYGPSAVYGSMNSASLPIAISLVLAQKCGITTQPVNDAVNRSRKFYKFYVDKGCIPYGEHPPADKHDSNGKNSMAAVFFDLLGDKEATKYFASMTLASYNTREGGHTGHFFAWQWGALAAARGGPAAAAAFVEKTRNFTELERQADGSSFYQPMLSGANKYNGCSTTGQRLMQHCLPRKVLYITGKVDSCIPPFTSAEVKDVLDAATFDPKGLSVKELMAKLGSWSVVVREAAAAELGIREDDLVDELITMLDSPNRYASYGAATALHFCGRRSEKAVDALVNKIENDKNISLRYFAVNALKIPKHNHHPNLLRDASRKAVPALLRIAAVYDPEDPNRMITSQMSEMFFYNGRVAGIAGFFGGGWGTETIDSKLLIPAMKAWLTVADGGARSMASEVYSHLKEEDLNQLWPEIYFAAKYQAPANAMFANGVRNNGMFILAQNRFEEGLPMAMEYLHQGGWGKYNRVPAAFNALSNYGSHLKPYLEEMRTKEYEPFINGRKPGEVGGCKAAWQKIMDNIDKNVELRSIKTYLDAAGIKDPVKVFPPNKDGSPREVVQAKAEGEEAAQTPNEGEPKEGGGEAGKDES